MYMYLCECVCHIFMHVSNFGCHVCVYVHLSGEHVSECICVYMCVYI